MPEERFGALGVLPVSTGANVITGSASGIGRGTFEFLEREGHRLIGFDRHDAEVIADLATWIGRSALPGAVRRAAGDAVGAVIACVRIGTTEPPRLIVRVDYFGAVATLDGLRLLRARPRPSSGRRDVAACNRGVRGQRDHGRMPCRRRRGRGGRSSAYRRPRLVEARAELTCRQSLHSRDGCDRSEAMAGRARAYF